MEQLTKVAKIGPGPSTGFEWVELFRIENDGPFYFPSSEIECVAWFSTPEIEAWIAARPQDFADGFIECFKRLG